MSISFLSQDLISKQTTLEEFKKRISYDKETEIIDALLSKLQEQMTFSKIISPNIIIWENCFYYLLLLSKNNPDNNIKIINFFNKNKKNIEKNEDLYRKVKTKLQEFPVDSKKEIIKETKSLPKIKTKQISFKNKDNQTLNKVIKSYSKALTDLEYSNKVFIYFPNYDYNEIKQIIKSSIFIDDKLEEITQIIVTINDLKNKYDNTKVKSYLERLEIWINTIKYLLITRVENDIEKFESEKNKNSDLRKIVENYNNIVTLIKYSTIDNELNIPQLNKENIKEIFKITPDCQIERNKTNYILGSIESIKELKTTSSKQLNQLSIIEDELKNLLKYLENPHKRATILLEDKFEISHCSNLVVPIKNYSDRNISFVGRREAKPKEIYTIDTNNTIDKDDAFSLEDEKDYLKLTGYITNVPKILNLECQPIINRAYRRGLSFYHKRHLLSTLFPEELTQNVLSLNADGIYHPVTSYSFILDKATKKIELENIKNELIKIDKNLKIKDIPQLINNGDKKIIDMSTNILEANRILRKEEKQENSIEVECNNFINSYSTLINETVAKIALCHNLIFIYLENNLYTNKASNTDIAYAKVSCPIREFVCFLNTYFQNCGILEPTMTNKEMYYWIDNIGDIIEYLNEQLILQKTIQKIK